MSTDTTTGLSLGTLVFLYQLVISQQVDVSHPDFVSLAAALATAKTELAAFIDGQLPGGDA